MQTEKKTEGVNGANIDQLILSEYYWACESKASNIASNKYESDIKQNESDVFVLLPLKP